ncbi:hypothetical protein, partial [Stenotrophomonas maltophilia]|uniref:hypothetical protein n=1 Tax=Stenotrophomonas maltophilia TaxID=40324 RepID=UPI0031B6E182
HCEKTFLADPARYLSHDAHDAHDNDGAAHDHAPTGVAAVSASTMQLAKDPICGMMVDKSTALSAERGGRKYYF